MKVLIYAKTCLSFASAGLIQKEYVLHTSILKSCEIHGFIDRGARSISVNPQHKHQTGTKPFLTALLCWDANTVLDASNQGYGLSYTNATVSIRSNQNSHTNVTQSFPISNGTRLGVLVDTHRGSLMFFHNGTFKCSLAESTILLGYGWSHNE